MRFWLDRGVDGFRVDVMPHLWKDEELRDNPRNPNWDGRLPFREYLPKYMINVPGIHDIVRQMRVVLDEYDERMMVGEIYLPIPELVKYYGEHFDECHLPFNFHLITTDEVRPRPWTAQSIRQIVDTYEAALPDGGWPNWVLGNHDQHRVATRIGPEQARVANMLLLTLRGTPTIYYGEEIGMEDVPIPPEKVQDPPAVNQPEIAHIVGRDPERTPMQWDDSPNAGFAAAGVETWLPVAKDYTEHNVARQESDPTSMLNLFCDLTALRRVEPALNVGDYVSVEVGAEDVFAYLRSGPNATRFLVALNFGGGEHTLDLGHVAISADIVVATDMVRTGSVDLSSLVLGPNEGLVLRLEAK